MPWLKGKKHSSETRRKMSAAHAERSGWRVVRLKEHEVYAGEALQKLAI